MKHRKYSIKFWDWNNQPSIASQELES